MIKDTQLLRDLVDMAAIYKKIPTPTCESVYILLRRCERELRDLSWKCQKYEHVLKQLDDIGTPKAGAVLKEDWGTQKWWEESLATDKDSLTVQKATTEQSSAVQDIGWPPPGTRALKMNADGKWEEVQG